MFCARNFTVILITTLQDGSFHKLREEGSKTLNKLPKDTQLVYYTAGIPMSSMFIQNSCLLQCIRVKIERRKVRCSILIVYVKAQIALGNIKEARTTLFEAMAVGKEAKNSNPLKQKSSVVLRAGMRRRL